MEAILQTNRLPSYVLNSLILRLGKGKNNFSEEGEGSIKCDIFIWHQTTKDIFGINLVKRLKNNSIGQ